MFRPALEGSHSNTKANPGACVPCVFVCVCMNVLHVCVCALSLSLSLFASGLPCLTLGMRIDKILTIPMPYRFLLIDSFIDSYWARGEKKSTNGFIYIHFLLYNFLSCCTHHIQYVYIHIDRKRTRLNSSHT